MKTVKELLKEYKINKEWPLLIIKGGTTFDVTWRYLEGSGGVWNDILDSKVINFGQDPSIGKIVFEVEP